jgi:hypothetical protein
MSFAKRAAAILAPMRGAAALPLLLLGGVIVFVTFNVVRASGSDPNPDRTNDRQARQLFKEGRRIFRFDTFGDEAFWGGQLQLHDAIKGEGLGGVGPGVSPNTALAVGLKVDVNALPREVKDALKAGEVDLDDPATTLTLLKLDAVVGLKGFFGEDDTLTSVGTTCALCHSTVDDSFAPGIGRRLDGWAAQDLNVGAIVSLAPNLTPLTDLLQVDEATVRTVLASWGPGKYDAILNQDGKAFRPDGKPAATRIPPAFGLAGHNLATWGAGWGTVTYWNAYVANTQMMGLGNFYDPRLNDPSKYPIAARTGRWNLRHDPDLITPKLAALHFYQLGLEPPEPPRGSFDPAAARRGEAIFNGKGTCAGCHVPPHFAEPGYNAHKPEEVCIDDFQANRTPDNAYVTAPLHAIFSKSKRGFYHDGRFPTLDAVVEHYNDCFGLELTAQEQADLVQFLKSR